MRISKQYDSKDCGLHVLQYFIKKLNKSDVEINYLKLKADYGPNGISLTTLGKVARENGLIIDTYKTNFDELKKIKNIDLPFIVLVEDEGLKHYLVIEKIDKNYVYIQDSRIGRKIKMNHTEFRSIYTGIMSFVYRDIENNQRQDIKCVDNKLKYLFSFNFNLFCIVFVSLLTMLLAFSSSFFVKIVFDLVIPNHLNKMLFALFIGFLWLNIVRFLSVFLKNLMTKKMANAIEIDIKERFFTKLQRIGLNEKSKITNSEIFKRLGYINFISEYKASFLYTFFAEFIAILFSSLFLIWLNLIIFGIVFSFSALCLIINIIFHFFIEKRYQKHLNLSHNNAQTEMDYVFGLTSFNDEYSLNFNELLRQEKLIKFKMSDYKLNKSKNVNNLVNDFLIGNLGLVIVFVSCFLIFKNQLTVGTLIMILTTMSYFVQPVASLTSIIMMNSIVAKHIDMINFVLNFKEINLENKGVMIEKIKEIELLDLNFGYESGNNNINIDAIKLNENTHLIGKNGCGKSTLLNLLNFKLSNWYGTLKINNHNVNFINILALKNDSILINDDVYIPQSTVYDFLVCRNQNIHKTLMNNIDFYGLDKVMERCNLTLNSFINNNGENISSGQRQLIILLKLFTKKFKLIMLDEAFENLDLEVNKKLINAIKNYQSDAFFIEISHSKKYASNGVEVDFEKINKTN